MCVCVRARATNEAETAGLVCEVYIIGQYCLGLIGRFCLQFDFHFRYDVLLGGETYKMSVNVFLVPFIK